MNIEQIHTAMQATESVHFIGIGGVSMSSLAEILYLAGYRVSGSDRTESAATRRLVGQGITVYPTHDDSNLGDAGVVVYTAAIPESNPELRRAREEGRTTLSRAELLGWLMLSYQKRIGVAGTHGKSTTTSMLAMIFMEANADPTVLSGAELRAMGGSYRIGGRENFLFEACEYKDSFLSFFPTTAVIGNVELDHTDYFPSLAVMENSFLQYLQKAKIGILNADDAATPRLAEQFDGTAVTFGLSEKADYRAVDIEMEGTECRFVLVHRTERLGEISLRIPGLHNVYNALAASAAAMENGADFEAVSRGLAAFGGASRRFDYLGTLNGARVYDDYAHHPSEIRATLTAAKRMGKRVVCVFQSHTYSRTAELFDDFADALSLADTLILCEIFAAREINTYGISAQKLAAAVKGAQCPGDFSEIARVLRQSVGQGDLVLLMGAGDVYKIASMLNLENQP